MQEHPEDNSLRLVFADWLEERGDKRGELLRLLHTLTQQSHLPDRDKWEERLRRLLREGIPPIGPFVTNSIGMALALIPSGVFLMAPQKARMAVNNLFGRRIGKSNTESQSANRFSLGCLL